jgi:flagellar hook-basal body complex protein FliE
VTLPAISSINTPMLDSTTGADGAASKPASGFAGMLQNSLGNLNDSQNNAESTMNDMAANKVDDVAQAMLTVEKANVQLQYATQLRNKVLDAYQEIMRMQM